MNEIQQLKEALEQVKLQLKPVPYTLRGMVDRLWELEDEEADYHPERDLITDAQHEIVRAIEYMDQAINSLKVEVE